MDYSITRGYFTYLKALLGYKSSNTDMILDWLVIMGFEKPLN